MKRLAVAALAIAVGAAAPAAAPSDTQPEMPPLVSQLIHCRSIAERDARLACFDDTAEKLDAATQKREIVVIDRDQIKKTKRTLFGLPIPNIDLFGSGKARPEDEVDQIEGVIASATMNGDGGWNVRLEDGALWQQIDSKPVALSPRPGFKVVIKRALMGSFMMQIQGQPGIRVKRVS
ncbi:MAG: hypothetical protein ACM3YM_00295 [Sphingomonadales bacterium]